MGSRGAKSFSPKESIQERGNIKQSNHLMLAGLLAPMEVDSSSSASATATIIASKWSYPYSVLQGPATTAPSAATAIDLYLISEEDTHYEQDILRDPYSSLDPWLRYLDYKAKTGSIHGQVFVFERACKALPRSYKLWKMVRVSWSFWWVFLLCSFDFSFFFQHCPPRGSGAFCLIVIYGDSH